MRQQLWAFDSVSVDLEDRDVTVTFVNFLTHAEVKIRFRIAENQLTGPADSLKRRLEVLASENILDLASFIDHQIW